MYVPMHWILFKLLSRNIYDGMAWLVNSLFQIQSFTLAKNHPKILALQTIVKEHESAVAVFPSLHSPLT